MSLIKKIIRQAQLILCAKFNIGSTKCVASGSDFYLVIRDTATAIQQSGLECKRCKRYIRFVS